MGLYVEVMCDLRKSRKSLDGSRWIKCYSDTNDNPQGHTVASARKEARRTGWKLTGQSGAICPNCAKA